MMEISKKRIFILIALLMVLTSVHMVFAESVWEGSAAMGRYGEFPFTGYYGASNSFPQNAYVEVENLENGKRTRVIVVDRLSDPGLLMLVSNEAAHELGIYQNDITRIKVRLLSSGATAETPKYDDLAYSPDPDINPAAALISPEKQAYNDIAESRATEPSEARETVAEANEPVKTEEAENETEFPVLSELPPEADGLKEAEVVETESDVPADIAEDSPEKPFDWPDSPVRTVNPEQETEPLYLVMDELEEKKPEAETTSVPDDIHSPKADVLWPDNAAGSTAGADDVAVPSAPDLTEEDLAQTEPPYEEIVSADALVSPEPALELLSSGLYETRPPLTSEKDFGISMLPQVKEKVNSEGVEYLTDSSDYYSPAEKEVPVITKGLPAPALNVPEEVIAVLVGDDILMEDYEPANEEINTGYMDSPGIVSVGRDLNLAFEDLADASPMISNDIITVAELPGLPGKDDAKLLDVADGYIAPGRADYTGEVADYPNPENAGAPIDVPKTDDELAYAVPEAVESAGMPEVTELPEVTGPDQSEAETDEVDMAVPEYDENLEVTLVPAEARPPELDDETIALAESGPVETVPPEKDIAGHVPEVAAAPDESETIKEPEPEVIAERMARTDTIAPERVLMVSKLQQQKHYLQLGAFKEKSSALKAAGRLDEAYPVTILTDEAATGVSYKLLLGPLSEDESGIMLFNFRAGGYSDAFIRRIE